jgi:transcriptional regulator with XRE-family HTH domain
MRIRSPSRKHDIFLDMDDVAKLLRETRARHGLSQSRLARRAGTTQAVVSRIERGETSPSMATLRRLLAAMGWELDAGLRRSPDVADVTAHEVGEYPPPPASG